MTRQNISSGAPWEAKVGYSRAVRVGPFVYVAGTTAVDERGQLVGKGDAYQQTVYIIKKIEKALLEAGARLSDVVRTRMFAVDVADGSEIGRAHSEFFGEVLPASTLVEIMRLVEPEMLIEIEADAVIGDWDERD